MYRQSVVFLRGYESWERGSGYGRFDKKLLLTDQRDDGRNWAVVATMQLFDDDLVSPGIP